MEKRIDVLLIEDDLDAAMLMSLHLSEACGPETRFAMESARTLEEGIRLLRERSFSVVILDLMLPDSRGIETVYRLRQAVPEVPVVVLTNVTDEQTAREAIDLGAKDFLLKEKLEPSRLRDAVADKSRTIEA